MVNRKSIHINADMGESISIEHKIMPFLNACNIACGGHTGDKYSMEKTIDLAVDHRVAIGAHPSYPDKENFGRKVMAIDSNELLEILIEQVISLQKIVKEKGQKINHIKPHGALYNQAAKEQNTADVIISLCKEFNGIELFCPPHSMVSKSATKAGIQITYEAFIDRRYQADFTLMSRSEDEAVILDPNVAWDQVKSIWHKNEVPNIGKFSKVDTLCVHGDNPSVVAILQKIRNEESSII